MAQIRFLTDDEWRHLIRDIHARQVIPVIGPELVAVNDTERGRQSTLVSCLAPRLAQSLDLDGAPQYHSLDSVACAHLLRGGARKRIYDELRDLIDKLSFPPSHPLLELASITDFEIYVTSTFDPLLALALEQKRFGFRRDRNVFSYHPLKKSDGDLPALLPNPSLYHILGNTDTYPEFAVCEEDYMEFLFGLIEQTAGDMLPELTPKLKSRQLLLLGAPFSDWIVRFFLRMARGQRLSERGSSGGDYITDLPENLGEPLIFFFDKLVNATRVIQGDPAAFVLELASRWRARYHPASNDEDFLARLPEDIPRGSVFISYSRDDLPAVVTFARTLSEAGVPVWLDKQRMKIGENYERSSENAVKDECSFFISVISAATEGNAERFVHKERAWAAQRHVDGFVFYIPVKIDGVTTAKLEPECFRRCHCEEAPHGVPGAAFLLQMQKLVEQYRRSGRPRG